MQCPGEVSMFFTILMNPCTDTIFVQSIILANLNDLIGDANDGAIVVNRLRVTEIRTSASCSPSSRGSLHVDLLVPTEIHVSIGSFESLPPGQDWIDTTLPSFDLAASLRPLADQIVNSLIVNIPGATADKNRMHLNFNLTSFPRRSGTPSSSPPVLSPNGDSPATFPSPSSNETLATPSSNGTTTLPMEPLLHLTPLQLGLIIGLVGAGILIFIVASLFIYRRCAKRDVYLKIATEEGYIEARGVLSPQR